MSLKKFRVTKANGEVVIIEAKNIEDAASLARSRFGQLPNDINDKISTNLITDITNLIRQLSENVIEIKKAEKSMEWEKVYAVSHSIINSLSSTSEDIGKLVGSLVKIDKEEN